MSRLDAKAKASGATQYVADLQLSNMAYATTVRSTFPRARIKNIDATAALAYPGVIGVYTWKDVSTKTFGRFITDVPILAQGQVRFVGERVVAIVAESREIAELAGSLIEIDYEVLPAVTTPEEAFAPGAPAVHDEPWKYGKAIAKEGDPTNQLAFPHMGNKEKAEDGLARAAFRIDSTYSMSAVHQGYLETQACVASVQPDGSYKVWITTKAPHQFRSQVANCLGIDPSMIDVQPLALGGDFGGKGSPQEGPLCIELSRLTQRPVKIVLRYSDDLMATNPRHPGTIRVRMGCDAEGNLLGVYSEALVNGGAYAAFTPSDVGSPAGFMVPPAYRIQGYYANSRVAYTNTVPKGNMRAPGAPQLCFAFESAIDELAIAAGIDPFEMRRRNLLVEGEKTPLGKQWLEYRGVETLEAAMAAYEPLPVPDGWLEGKGVSIHSRLDSSKLPMSLRIIPEDNGGVTVQLPFVETGTGNHTTMNRLIAERLGLPIDKVTIAQMPTSSTLHDGMAIGGAKVTTSLAVSVDVVAEAWNKRTNNEPIDIEIAPVENEKVVGVYTVQIAQVAVDPGTGQVKVLQILTAADVGDIVNPVGHQIQIDGGAIMGFGYGCLEDLDESDGQVWAANLGEFKFASQRDAPALRTVLLRGGIGLGASNVKGIGEHTTPLTAPAIANAVFDATRRRARDLPITAERVYRTLQEESSVDTANGTPKILASSVS